MGSKVDFPSFPSKNRGSPTSDHGGRVNQAVPTDSRASKELCANGLDEGENWGAIKAAAHR